MYNETDLLPLSALQHLLYCPRQCALIHIEQAWVENRYTAEGRLMHERVDGGQGEFQGQVRIERAVALRSLELGLIGKADVVEFHTDSENNWRPFPVEYKRGRPKKHAADTVQLCAQAMCLEEMLDTVIPEGALYYGKTRRRLPISFDLKLREKTIQTAAALHELMATGVTPPPIYGPKCDKCSFLTVCRPKNCDGSRSASHYLQQIIEGG
jgi:CRISPR-associated exonuclease Cas4